MKKNRVLFMGTPDFSVPCLEMLLKREDVIITGVVTQPDRQKGRGYKMLPPAVKVCALENNLDVYQPQSVKDDSFQTLIKKLDPELIIVIAYGKILPEFVLDYPKLGCINVHASLLPKYRGAAPIQWCVLNGEKVSGVTTMFMDKGLDTGDMLVTKKITLDELETSGTLFDKMSVLGVEALSETLDLIAQNKLVRTPQNHSEMTYAPMIEKEFSYIDWSKSADEISRLIRGLNPMPGAKTYLNGKLLKILMAKPFDELTEQNGGTITESNDKLLIACGDKKQLEVLVLQPEGKKQMNVSDYLKGNPPKKGTILENK